MVSGPHQDPVAMAGRPRIGRRDPAPMNEATLIETIMDTIGKQLRQPPPPFDPALELRRLPDYDSVMMIQIVLDLENAFDIALDEDEIEAMVTLGDVRAVVLAQVADVV